jgi:hypothetical protein
MHHGAGHQTLALAFDCDEQCFADPERDQAAAEQIETIMVKIKAAAAAVPASDWKARRHTQLVELTAQIQLKYGASYLRLRACGSSNPFAKLPLTNLPENMQPVYKEALQRAAGAGSAADSASGVDAGYTGDDSDTDTSDNDASDNNSGNDDNDAENNDGKVDENDENRC